MQRYQVGGISRDGQDVPRDHDDSDDDENIALETELLIDEEDNISTDEEDCHNDGDDDDDDESEDSDRFIFKMSNFSGELIHDETIGTVTIKVYKNNSSNQNNFALHNFPLIFFDNCTDNVFYCKKHCELVFNHKNLHTAVNRIGGDITTIKRNQLNMFKAALTRIQSQNTSNLQIELSFHAHRISLISFGDLMKVAEKRQDCGGWKKEELSSLYSHKFFIVIKEQ